MIHVVVVYYQRGDYMTTSRSKLQCNERHLEKLERITIRLYKDGTSGITKKQIEGMASKSNMSVNLWITETLKRAAED